MLGEIEDEEFVPEEEAENPGIAIKRLREKLAKAEAERAEYLDGWQRSKADFVNFKRDEEARRGYTQERMAASLAEEIIPVLDSFEMAAKHNKNKELEIIQKQLLDAIKKMGIESFGKEGEAFNPEMHEAVREVSVDTPEKDHTVVSVERSGYAIKSTGQSGSSHIIRPAQVSVGTFAEAKKI
ncbi:MAG: molecular chaperone GrpE [Parcubacteria group bacterium Gr01-1014_56]|nr:MAG: molecular chaperone GrpE [Parcubacteria group bacterium Gr01-1014_56]